MICETFELDIDYGEYARNKCGEKPKISVMIPNETPGTRKYTPSRPSVLILPGGAYRFTSDREAEPVAAEYLARGFNCFILRYSVSPSRFPVSLIETGYVVRSMRENAGKWLVDGNGIFLAGFSAGGHLAASYGAYRESGILTSVLGGSAADYAVKGLILGYPVISDDFEGEFDGTRQSYLNLLGKDPDPELKRRLDLENAVTPRYPPCFIAHAADDNVVPAATSLRFAGKLSENGVPFELHIYEKGGHGFSTGTKVVCEKEKRLQNWIGESVSWIRERIADA